MSEGAIAAIPVLVGFIALTVAIAGWDAAVYARRHFELPKERITRWSRECGEAFESLLVADVCARLKEREQPPVRYELRSYALFDLPNDITELHSFDSMPKWDVHYVEWSIIAPIRRAIISSTDHWHQAQKPDGLPASTTGSLIREEAGYGLQRVGMLQEQIAKCERVSWIRSLTRRRHSRKLRVELSKERRKEQIRSASSGVRFDYSVPL